MKTETYKPVKQNTRDNPNLGECRHCDYHPVAINAHYCPHCGGSSPNPGFQAIKLLAPILFLIFVVMVFQIFNMIDSAAPLIEAPEVVESALGRLNLFN